jgi:DNA-binding transcriptional ArsR family regulator
VVGPPVDEGAIASELPAPGRDERRSATEGEGEGEGEDVTRQAITKHLAVLHDAGLVRDVRRGRERLWELERAPLDEAHGYLERVSQRWDQRLARLAALVEQR